MGWRHRVKYVRLRSAVLSLQCCCRYRIAKTVLRMLRSIQTAIKIQSWLRMKHKKRIFLQKKTAATTISSWARMVSQRAKYLEILRIAEVNSQLASQVEILKCRLIQEADMRVEAERVSDIKIVERSHNVFMHKLIYAHS